MEAAASGNRVAHLAAAGPGRAWRPCPSRGRRWRMLVLLCLVDSKAHEDAEPNKLSSRRRGFVRLQCLQTGPGCMMSLAGRRRGFVYSSMPPSLTSPLGQRVPACLLVDALPNGCLLPSYPSSCTCV